MTPATRRSTSRTALQAMVTSLAMVGTAHAQAPPSATCESLARQQLPATTISVAQEITTGSFTPSGSTNTISNLPPFCRLAGIIAPTSESQIRFEVWLPLNAWTGKFAGVGNGGWAGTISYPQLAEQLRRGHAAASTNTGHDASPGLNMARFAFEKPEQLVDFAYRAHHELAVQAKALTHAFYGKPAERAYFVGCSSGGYEGLMEAQRFPADYDGILAAAPANNWTRLMAGDLENVLATLQDPASLLTPNALSLLYRGTLAACDALDGVVDAALEDPRRCTFDPGTLACGTASDGKSCLTPAQLTAARRVYRGAKDPNTGVQLYPGLVPGSETFWVNRDPATPFPIPISHYRWLVFRDANWDWRTFDVSDPADFRAHQEAERKLAPILNATNPDLREFRKRGGKLLQYHGWNDPLITPLNSINYYESVVSFFEEQQPRTTKADVNSFYRLFMVPGMAHCAGGTGPSTFDAQTALEQWVERGVAPDRIIATRAINGVVDRSRPLCVYPKTAVYLGKGDINEAANFVCRDPAGPPR